MSIELFTYLSQETGAGITPHYLPGIIITAASLLLLLTISVKRSHALAAAITGAGLVLAALAQLALLQAPAASGSLFHFDAINTLLSLLLLLLLIFLWAQMPGWLAGQEEPKEEYYLLFQLAGLGGWAMLASNHFASFFLALELMSLSLVGLISYRASLSDSLEAGIKYLVLSSLASALILMGMALLYLQSGSLAFDAVFTPVSQEPQVSAYGITAAVFIITGLMFKLSLVPCHLWAADIFEGAPLPSTALLAVLSKLASFILLWRLFGMAFWYDNPLLMQLIALVAAASMLLGNILALQQRQLLRLLAFSSIAHFGYLLLTLLLLGRPESAGQAPIATSPLHAGSGINAGMGLVTEALLFYLIAYLLTLTATFSLLLRLRHISRLEQLSGLFWYKPLTAAALAILMLSFAGVPLTLGFVGKFYLLSAAVAGQLWWLLYVLVIASVISLFYYLRVIMVMLERRGEPRDLGKAAAAYGVSLPMRQTGLAETLLSSLVILLIVGLGTFPGQLATYLNSLIP
ncbi:NADH-quinone oxidoreductase subunit N [Shewanella salipaludis]|uniref:NADH-quinone oxidoreductase subunit N n=1 Tax=Shewanella salipaludis TaxID=2723052 RepID=UPI001B7D1D1F|nr:NADH-quinone oxidoreductase subunit N [Shewanella salipaludis]